jgi:four helix bundle protein
MAIGANISEAQQAESRSDFIHKMKIAAKEASETHHHIFYLSTLATLQSQ